MDFGQSRIDSIMETVVNTFIGYFVALAIWHFCIMCFHIPTSQSENFIIVAIFTVASLLRQYIIRRIFNKLTIWETIKGVFNG